jgi:hypothetical protein
MFLESGKPTKLWRKKISGKDLKFIHELLDGLLRFGSGRLGAPACPLWSLDCRGLPRSNVKLGTAPLHDPITVMNHNIAARKASITASCR